MSTPSGVYVDDVCFCVTAGQCVNGTSSSGSNNKPNIEESDGSLDSRNFKFETTTQGTTANFRLSFTPNLFPVTTGIKPALRNQTSCATGLELCCPEKGFSCGIRYPPVAGAPKPSEPGQSEYGAYPWDVAILSSSYNEYIGAGVLIDHRHVVTVAHKVYKAYDIKCRFGEWNMSSNFEPLPPQEVEVDDEDIVVHPDFNSLRTLRNNIAVLRLNAPGIQLGLYPTITSICLPSHPLTDMRCWVAGWGKSSFNSNSYQTILKQVSLPLVEHFTCQNQLRQTRLGQNFMLDPLSFICAGGEANKDACTGDGGAALACDVNGRFYLAGLVAWGIGCGNRNIPGVYTNVYNFIPWIQSVVRKTREVSMSAVTNGIQKSTFSSSVLSTQAGSVSSTSSSILSTVAGSIATQTTKSVNSSITTVKPLNTTVTTKAPAVTTKGVASAIATTTKPTTLSGSGTTDDDTDGSSASIEPRSNEEDGSTDANDGDTDEKNSTSSSISSVAATTKPPVANATTITTKPAAVTTKPASVTTKPPASNVNTTKASGTTVKATVTTVKGGVTTKATVKGGVTTKPTVKAGVTTKPTVKGAITTKPTVKGAITTKPTVKGVTTKATPKPSG